MMLDPRAQKKNGFGAFIAREQERHFARETEAARLTQADGDLRSPYAPAAGPEQADAPVVATDGRSS
jgi:hypothetical protein